MTFRLHTLLAGCLALITAALLALAPASANPTSGGYQLFERAASGISADIQLASLGNFAPPPETASECCIAPNTTTISSPLPNGQPGAIWRGFGEPNARQQGLLDQLQSPGDTIIIPKSGISQQDLAALTAATGDEFAVFTTGGRRMVVRGGADNFGGLIDESWAAARAAEGWRFSAHTHPIPDNVNPGIVMRSSEGDRAILDLFDNQNSAILGSNGARQLFDSAGDW